MELIIGVVLVAISGMANAGLLLLLSLGDLLTLPLRTALGAQAFSALAPLFGGS